MPDENNLAGNAFMLTPKGALSSTDKVLDELKLINASECTVSSDNYSALYTSSESNQIKNSGFSFDIILKDVPGGKTGIVGFSYGATINAENFSGYANALTALEKLDYAEEGGYRYYLVDKDGFASMNIAVKDGINNKDITDKVTCGAMISGNSYAC